MWGGKQVVGFCFGSQQENYLEWIIFVCWVWVLFLSQLSIWCHGQDSLCVRCSGSGPNSVYRSRWEVDVKIIVWILHISGIQKNPTFQPTEALLFPCTMGLCKWVVRYKHSLVEQKSIMHSNQFWSPVTWSTFTLPRGMSFNTGLLIVHKL